MPLRQIQEREEELSEVEQTARRVRRKQIPQRRFGAGVTPQQQQEVVRQRGEADDILSRIPEERRRLSEARQAALEYQRQEEQRKDIEAGRRAAEAAVFRGKGQAVFGLQNAAQRKAFAAYVKAFKSEKGYYETQTRLGEQGIKPVYVGGELVAFQDTVRGQTVPTSTLSSLDVESLKRYEKAGAITIGKATTAPTARELALNMSLPESERFKLPQSYVESDGIGRERRVLDGSGVSKLPISYLIHNPVVSYIKSSTQDLGKGLKRSGLQSGSFGIIDPKYFGKGRDPEVDKELRKLTGATYEQAKAAEVQLALLVTPAKVGKVKLPFFFDTSGRVAVGLYGQDTKRLFQIGKALEKDEPLPSGRQAELNREIDRFNKEIEKFESSWKSRTSGQQFTGSETEYESYMKDFEKIQKKEAGLREYEKEIRQRPITKGEAYGTALKSFGTGALFGGIAKGLKLGGRSLGFQGGGKIGAVAGGAVQVYFKGQIIRSAVDVGVNIKRNERELAKLQALSLGSSLAGYAVGGYATEKSFLKVSDIKRTWGKRYLEQPDPTTKAFLKPQAEPGKIVFYRRYEGVKIFDPRTYWPWLSTRVGITQYKKGQFLKRQYQIIPPQVRASLEKRESFPEYYIDKKGGLRTRGAKPTSFPLDVPSKHSSMAFGKEYALPGVPKALRKKAFGYSATPEEFSGRKFSPQVLKDLSKVSGKEPKMKELKLKGAYQFFSFKGLSAYFFRLGKGGYGESKAGTESPIRPTAYAGYFEGIQKQKALGEVKGTAFPDTTMGKLKGLFGFGGRELKAYIYTKPTKEGIPAIPGYKREVEGTVEYTERIPFRRDFYLKLFGRRVVLEEQTFKTPKSQRASPIEKMAKQSGLKSTPQVSSYLPSGQIRVRLSAFSQPSSKASARLSATRLPSSSKLSSISLSVSSSLSKLSSKPSSKPSSSPRSSPYSSPLSYRSSSSSLISRPSSRPPSPPRSPGRKVSRLILPRFGRGKGIGRVRGYRAFVIKKGKKKYIGLAAPKGKALRKGEEEALKTLRATFGVEPTSMMVSGKDVSFTPKSSLFRGFRIRQGKKIPLRDTFIQRKGKRLATFGERRELSTARRRKR